jgi:dipeptidyl aminopeptidase/acylaminoacyl peptidase
VQGLAFSPDGKFLASGSADRTARTWRVASSPGAATRVLHDGRTPDTYPIPDTAVAVSPDGARIVVGTAYGGMHVLDAASGRTAFDLDLGAFVGDIAYSPDGQTLGVASDAGASLRASSDGHVIRTLTTPTPTRSVQIRFRPDGSIAATADVDGQIRLWDTASGRLLRSMGMGSGELTTVAFSTDGSSLASGNQGGAVRIWDPDTAAVLADLPATNTRVADLHFTPDGSGLIVAGDNREVRMWDLRAKAYVRAFRGHTAAVLEMAMSADGRTLVTVSEDRTARVWDTRTGRLLRILVGHIDFVTAVAIEPRDGSIVTGSLDGRIAEWDACTWCTSLPALRDRLEAATLRCFTLDERRTLLGENPTSDVEPPCAA